MPFGLANAPATFQAYINRALAGLVDVTCIVISKNAQMHYSTSGASDAPDAPDVLRGTGWNEIYPYILTQYKCFLRPGATMMS